MIHFQSSQFFLLSLTILDGFTLASPEDTAFEPKFVPEPTGRGTVGVIWSCIFTLALCVWTAIHGDITPKPTIVRRTLYKMVWMLVALLGPEVAVAYALRQLLEAREVHEEWCKKFNVKPGDKQDRLGMEGAFFVVMGGYVTMVDQGDESAALTLTPKGFIHFTKSGEIPMEAVDRRIIIDKGKASGLGKLIVVLQASWMVVQATARYLSGFNITLLEIHVVIHVTFVFVMYCLWWHKPLDTCEPISLVSLRKKATLGSPLEEPEYFLEQQETGSVFEWTQTFWDIILTVTTLDTPIPLCSVLLMLFINGALHATAWNYHFPTNSEKVLWRISCLFISLGPLAQTLILASIRYNKRTQSSYKKISCDPVYRSVPIMLVQILLYGIYYLFYAFSLTFMVIEAFISMRNVPVGSYETIKWLDWWRHL